MHGRVLVLLLSAHREEVARAVGNRHFTFSLLVHSDASSPMVDWSQNSSILQVCHLGLTLASALTDSLRRCCAWVVSCSAIASTLARWQAHGSPLAGPQHWVCCSLLCLQVRSDCPPRQLVDFLLSDSGVEADQVRKGGQPVD